MIRTATINDLEQIYDLLLVIFQDMELPLLKLVPADTLKKMVVEAMHNDDYRYGKNHALVCERDGKLAGVAFGYPGEKEPYIDHPLTALYTKFGVQTDMPLFVDSETFAGEWYLDSIVTHPDFRRQGVAKELIDALPEKANADGEHIIGLNCEVINHKAYQLYEAIGFRKHSNRVLSGHDYIHMQWIL